MECEAFYKIMTKINVIKQLTAKICMVLLPIQVTRGLMQTDLCSMGSRTREKDCKGTQSAHKCNLNLCNAAILAGVIKTVL